MMQMPSLAGYRSWAIRDAAIDDQHGAALHPATNSEPPLAEMLRDPLVNLVMTRDRVSMQELLGVIAVFRAHSSSVGSAPGTTI
jgi:hypothetical protein